MMHYTLTLDGCMESHTRSRVLPCCIVWWMLQNPRTQGQCRNPRHDADILLRVIIRFMDPALSHRVNIKLWQHEVQEACTSYLRSSFDSFSYTPQNYKFIKKPENIANGLLLISSTPNITRSIVLEHHHHSRTTTIWPATPSFVYVFYHKFTNMVLHPTQQNAYNKFYPME